MMPLQKMLWRQMLVPKSLVLMMPVLPILGKMMPLPWMPWQRMPVPPMPLLTMPGMN
jgi:hypothetical protein